MTDAAPAIEYNHGLNRHTLRGAAETLSTIFGADLPHSLLDIGCGTGTWVRAAIELGVTDVFGVDGIIVGEHEIQVPGHLIEQRDLSVPFDLGRRYDAAICLEVAEHLPEAAAAGLISSIVSHSDTILFSAACPGQG